MSEADALSALKVSVVQSDTQRIKELIAQYPSLLEKSDVKGMRPLHWASEAQSLSSIACLVDLGADVTQKEAMGYTPEQIAYWHGEFRMGAYTDVCLKIVDRLKKSPTAENT
ncbi:hypothetical protein CMV30_16135 [Nibricoccus aquaticus]|uniref:Uncharacterized protein n=2 Tax=Nibricoccus aquaticus TaxID=2576891 RepID=A0A290QG32_9BACT|nr:hypothetical protein CMV30_16135 [Nibricoccus aquaticus]